MFPRRDIRKPMPRLGGEEHKGFRCMNEAARNFLEVSWASLFRWFLCVKRGHRRLKRHLRVDMESATLKLVRYNYGPSGDPTPS